MQKLDSVIRYALQGSLPTIIFLCAVVLGLFALQMTPREEEPQIVVPMLDIHVSVPNTASPEVARLVTTPLEKLLLQIPGVEHVYSTTQTGGTVVTLRFHVGEDREKAILNTYTKLYANQHTMPGIVTQWQIRPIEVDDVPILMLGLTSSKPQLYDDYALTRFAQELSIQLQSIADTSEVTVITGRTRALRVELNLAALAAHQTTPMDVLGAIQSSNLVTRVGQVTAGSNTIAFESGDVLRNKSALEGLTVNVINGRAIVLKEVARVIDGPSEPDSYQWLTSSDSQADVPLVTIGVAKQKGSNAVTVAEQSLALVTQLQQELLPAEVSVKVLRNYGETANDKVNNLTSSLAFAVFTVVVFVGVFLGWRPAIVVGLAVPICYGITLGLDFAFGYTINRVTLFALILSLGLLVDDPITGIDNISRFIHRGAAADTDHNIVAAMVEIKSALLMSTLTIIMAFIPLAFITGMMGPYMAPMAFNVPISVIASTLVAFLVTPWLSKKLLKADSKTSEVAPQDSYYSKIMLPILQNPRKAKWFLWGVLGLFVASVSLPIFRAVPLKLLPFDNKSEIQVLIDMPEGTSLEQTAAMARQVQQIVWSEAEVTDIAAFVGKPSSMDFNGMVRGYYRRSGTHLAELRVLLVDKREREHQSHAIVMRLREKLQPFNQTLTQVKVVEVPPGPPVLSTLVAEVYADPFVARETQEQAAQRLAHRLRQEPHVVEVDTSMASPTWLKRFVVDKQKAALSGVATEDINQSLVVASSGMSAGFLYTQGEVATVPIELGVSYAQRNQWQNVLAMQVRGRQELAKTTQEYGLEQAARPLVAIGELGELTSIPTAPVILRKDLQEVIYVFAELNGRTPAEVIADVVADENQQITPSNWASRTFLHSGGGVTWSMFEGTHYTFKGEGEWRITIDVFRDMGIAFAFALVAIFIILRVQTASSSLSLIIMSAIPLTMIGIMPGFWLLNQFGERVVSGAPEPVLFTATAMIGMIALAGIVVRNSLILVEFINQSRAAGMALIDALIAAGSVRMRPVLLTAGTTLLGNLVIILDPVFSGLALAIIFGIIASTLFSLLVVPIVYYLVFKSSSTPNQPLNTSSVQESSHVS
ncbi:acriflavine resistance protein B [Pseudoalteromonas sp. GCY]|uniref:efflux RND transporter permease subunit n=1 Tax=Pseudoalteromonas sp. GCY TaxID=2003316 RepID=UPI000BFEC4EE|nr:efflux RND transporter permease subunit [Pseudoalteromonas sp. GCY]PHI36051.1 acriflavine resistance protein B [Pseudoalteromonas sp. GCY]QQQ67083.1 efflux RND transporter permease subunit [Pseudoalteromonas sp. GCY]